MARGEVRFIINGVKFGIAFQSDDLKVGPIYPAVSFREGTSVSIITPNDDGLRKLSY